VGLGCVLPIVESAALQITGGSQRYESTGLVPAGARQTLEERVRDAGGQAS
jgi:hypothetical protein